MDKIVDIEKRLEKKRKKEDLERRRNKIRSLRRSVQCSCCRMRCAMCGFQAGTRGAAAEENTMISLGFALCEDCREEYEDFLSVYKDGESSDIQWHNEEWIEMWSSWLRYRTALNAFIHSAEFKSMLLEDFEA